MARYPAIVTGREYDGEIDSYSHLVSAPGPYLEPGEFIYLEASSTDASATLRLSLKFLSTDNQIRSTYVDMAITGTGNQSAVTSRIGPCWIMGFSVRVVAGTITDGEIVASVHIARAGASTPVHVMTLASGEVTNTRALGLGAFTAQGTGGSVATQPTVTTATAAPAAGANFTFTVTASQVWEIFGVRALLTTSATVATRTYSIIFDDGTNVIFRHEASLTQAASLAYGYSSNNVGALWTPITNNVYLVPIPQLMLPAGGRIRSQVTNIQAGDTLTECTVLYRQY